MQPTVFITGATSGFGEACARRFAQAGWKLVITGRRTERLDALREYLEGDEVVIAVDLGVAAGTFTATHQEFWDRARRRLGDRSRLGLRRRLDHRLGLLGRGAGNQAAAAGTRKQNQCHEQLQQHRKAVGP